MSEVDELFESMRSAMAASARPDFDDVTRRRRLSSARRRLAAGSATLVVAGVAGVAGTGAYPSLPGHSAAPNIAEVSATATTTSAGGRAAPVPSDGPCVSAQLPLATGTTGQADPITAAETFARQGDDGYPVDGWHIVYQQSGDVVQVESGGADALVLRATGGTWQVISAQRCP